jgi:mRNA interferase MazF
MTRVRRGEVFLVALEPSRGREIQKTRPCLIISPDQLNATLATFLIAPLTTGSRSYPFRVACRFAGKQGHVVLDQIRVVDRSRLVRRLGVLGRPVVTTALKTLQEMFAE